MLYCITNSMDDVRSCTIKGQHQLVCDGWTYRYDRDKYREIATGKSCKGCRPREAQKGLLCWACWERVELAFADWTPLRERMLYEHDRLVQRDNAGVRSQIVGYVNLPATTLALNEILSYLKSCEEMPVGQWVCSADGAKDAVRFARSVASAVRTHQIEENQRAMHRVRCPKCGRLSLVRKPPDGYKEPVTVECQTEGCGKLIDRDSSLVEIAKMERIPA